MKNMFINLVCSILSVDNICKLIGYGLGKLLAWARNKDCWDKLKLIIGKVRGWLDVIDEVIEDDTLSEEEEAKIVDALKDTKVMNKVTDVIQKATTEVNIDVK